MTNKRRTVRVVYIDGVAFHTRKVTGNLRYLRCTYFTKTRCKASAKINIDAPDESAILMNSEHNHSFNKADILKVEFKKALKKEICRDSGTYKGIYDELAKKFPEGAELCPYNSIKKSLIRWRFNFTSSKRNFTTPDKRKTNMPKAKPSTTKFKNSVVINQGTPKILNHEFPFPVKRKWKSHVYDSAVERLSPEDVSNTGTEESITTFTIKNITKANMNGNQTLQDEDEEELNSTEKSKSEEEELSSEEELNNEEESSNEELHSEESDHKVLVIIKNLQNKVRKLEANVNVLSSRLTEERSTRIKLQNIVKKYLNDYNGSNKDVGIFAD